MKRNKNTGISTVLMVLYVAIGIFIASTLYSIADMTIKRSRDSHRLRDFAEIHRALELYYHDHEDYPIIRANEAIFSTDQEWGSFLDALKPYMTGRPVDPRNNAREPWIAGNYSYVYITGEKDDAGVRTYDLITALEDETSEHTCKNAHWTMHVSRERFGWCDNNPASPYGSNDMIYSDH